MSIKDDLEQWRDVEDNIRSHIEAFRQRVADIEQEIGYEPELRFPPTEEKLKSFQLIEEDDVVNTHWEYIDGWEAICDSSSNWPIPLSWFELSDEELIAAMAKKAQEDDEAYISGRLCQIAHELDHFGYELVQKGSPDNT